MRGDLRRTLLTPDSATIGQLVIDGSLAGTGEVDAGNIGDLAIGRDLQGTVQVAGTLNHLSTGGAMSGTIAAGNIGDLAIGGDLQGARAGAGHSGAREHGRRDAGDDRGRERRRRGDRPRPASRPAGRGHLNHLRQVSAMSGTIAAGNIGDWRSVAICKAVQGLAR